MIKVLSNDKEVFYGNTEVSRCHFHLLLLYGCGGEIERFWRRWSASEPCPSDRCSEPALFCVVPMVWPIAKSSVASARPWTRCCDGEIAIKNKASTVYRIYLDLAGRRLFPPQQQHKIVALATQPPPEQDCPITHWSMVDLQRAVLQKGIAEGISAVTIWRLLDQAAIKPHLWHYWLNSNDPDFDRKMQDIVDLYLQAPEMYLWDEIVLSVDEKTSIQALERKYPSLPTRPGSPELLEHEYIRHGTCCLTAGFEVATGSVMSLLTPNRPAEVFAEFIQWVCDYYSDRSKLHIVLDNLNTHYHEQVCRVVAEVCQVKPGELTTGRQRQAFLCDPAKWLVFHFTPTHASWLNQIEIWFSTLSRKVINRGNFSSVADLENKIVAFIKYYNHNLAKPYQWTYTGKPLAQYRKVS